MWRETFHVPGKPPYHADLSEKEAEKEANISFMGRMNGEGKKEKVTEEMSGEKTQRAVTCDSELC